MATINVAKRKVVVFSGGSAANNLVDVFNEVIEKNNCALTYVIPISDNGGSSSEIIRVFGGPGIGDVRSRLAFCICCCTSLSFYRFSPSTIVENVFSDLALFTLPMRGFRSKTLRLTQDLVRSSRPPHPTNPCPHTKPL